MAGECTSFGTTFATFVAFLTYFAGNSMLDFSPRQAATSSHVNDGAVTALTW
jgi:hypothetical protein